MTKTNMVALKRGSRYFQIFTSTGLNNWTNLHGRSKRISRIVLGISLIDNPSNVYATKSGTLNICEIENCCKDFELHSSVCFLRLDYAQRGIMLANNSYLLDAVLNYSCVNKNVSSSLALFGKLVAKIALVSKILSIKQGKLLDLYQALYGHLIIGHLPMDEPSRVLFTQLISPKRSLVLFLRLHIEKAPSDMVHHWICIKGASFGYLIMDDLLWLTLLGFVYITRCPQREI